MERRELLKRVGLSSLIAVAGVGGLYSYPLIFSKAHKSLMIAGSSAVSRFVSFLVEPFLKQDPNVDIALEGGDSLTGLVSLVNGGIDIAMMSRGLSFGEYNPDLVVNLLGFEGVALIVNPNNPVQGLSIEQVNGILRGQIKNWSELGGLTGEIQVYGRNESSTTRGLIQYFVMKGAAFSSKTKNLESARQVVDAVADDRNAFAYVTAKYLENRIRGLAIGGVEVSNKSLLLGTYPLRREIFLVTKVPSTAVTKQFIAFGLGNAGQDTLEDRGLTRIN
jgi:phosphate transport system substrate-binding protein